MDQLDDASRLGDLQLAHDDDDGEATVVGVRLLAGKNRGGS